MPFVARVPMLAFALSAALTPLWVACPLPPATASCAADADEQGNEAFRSQTATRVDVRALELQFTLKTTVDERFAATPTITTNLGTVSDAEASRSALRVAIVQDSASLPNGFVDLEGDIRAEFGPDRQRCPFRRRFLVSQHADEPIQVR